MIEKAIAKIAATVLAIAINAVPVPYSFDPAADLQYPELPTGCEATAGSILLRMNGYDVSKTEVADAMPKSTTDFVEHFNGDPYAYGPYLQTCSGPCLEETLNGFIGDDARAVAIKDMELDQIHTPFCAWVTMGLSESYVMASSNGYVAVSGNHCVCVISVTDEKILCIDPLKGLMEYRFDAFDRAYRLLGMQSVTVEKIMVAE